MSARTATVILACAYLLAPGAWLLAQMALALDAGRPVADIGVAGTRGFLLLQALVVVAAAPLFVSALGARRAAGSLAAVVLAALPLLTFVSLTTTLSALRLLAAEGAVLAAAVVTAGIAALVVRAVRDAGVRLLALGVLQVGVVAGCWRFHAAWIAGVVP